MTRDLFLFLIICGVLGVFWVYLEEAALFNHQENENEENH